LESAASHSPGYSSTSANVDREFFEEILHYALLSQLAYRSDEQIREKYPNAEIVVTDPAKIKFFIIYDEKTLTQTVAIRGTANWENLLIDAKFWKAKDFFLQIKLHSGFYKAARELVWRVVFRLRDEYKTIITGHSMGGAVGLIMAMYLADMGFPVERVVTFGQPRVTDKEGIEVFGHVPLLRVTHKYDLVSLLPPWQKYFRHFGDWLQFDGQNYTWQEKESEQTEIGDPGTSKKAKKLWDKLEEKKSGSVGNKGSGFGEFHLLPMYISSLRRLIEHVESQENLRSP